MSNNEEPEVLKVTVSESVGLKDVPPGGQAPTLKEIEENLPKEEIEKRQKIMLEYTRLSSRYCEPHNLKSKWVTDADIPKVLADGKDLVAMCNLPRGKYSGISALAHSQMDDKDPLRFFVLPTGMVIINPVIVNHTNTIIPKAEGCMSFPDRDIIKDIPRYNKITVRYQTLATIEGSDLPVLSKIVTEGITGGSSHVFQHECSHLNGFNIYDEVYPATSSIGFGDGTTVEIVEEVEKLIERIEENK